MNNILSGLVDQLCDAILDSSEYQGYKRQQEIVKDQPEVIDKINELRNLNMRLQSIQNSDEAYEEYEKLEKRFEELSDDKRVFDFMEAENRFIGVYRELNKRIMDHIQFI